MEFLRIVFQIPDEEIGQSQSRETKRLIYEKDKLQEKIYALDLDILSERKWLLTTQIDIRKRELSGNLAQNFFLYVQLLFNPSFTK